MFDHENCDHAPILKLANMHKVGGLIHLFFFFPIIKRKKKKGKRIPSPVLDIKDDYDFYPEINCLDVKKRCYMV
jgi:hypothetical protein